jgi:hypothetical protein
MRGLKREGGEEAPGRRRGENESANVVGFSFPFARVGVMISFRLGSFETPAFFLYSALLP